MSGIWPYATGIRCSATREGLFNVLAYGLRHVRRDPRRLLQRGRLGQVKEAPHRRSPRPYCGGRIKREKAKGEPAAAPPTVVGLAPWAILGPEEEEMSQEASETICLQKPQACPLCWKSARLLDGERSVCVDGHNLCARCGQPRCSCFRSQKSPVDPPGAASQLAEQRDDGASAFNGAGSLIHTPRRRWHRRRHRIGRLSWGRVRPDERS